MIGGKGTKLTVHDTDTAMRLKQELLCRIAR